MDPVEPAQLDGADGATVPTSGFDVRPDRPAVVSAVLLVVVVTAAAMFAHYYRDSLHWAVELYSDASTTTGAARRLPRLVVFALVAATVAFAATVGWFVERRWLGPHRRGGDRRVGARRGAPHLGQGRHGMAGGRDVGGVVGTRVDRYASRRSSRPAARSARSPAGGHTGAATRWPRPGSPRRSPAPTTRRSPRSSTSRSTSASAAAVGALWFVVLGAIGGHLVAATWLGGQAIFPPIQGSRWSVLRLGLVVLVPAALTARLLLAMRTHITIRAIIQRTGARPWR